MIIIATNVITILFLTGTIIVLTQKTRMHTKKSLPQYQLLFSFLLLIIGTLADTFEHLGYSKLFDTYGEYIMLLFFPLIIFSILTYSINSELEKRKQSETLLQHQNEEYLNMNRQLVEGTDNIKKINEALTKTNMELDSFVYRVSHDLRSPICTSMGLTDLSLQSNDINEIKHYLGLQETSLKRLDQFIIDILNYSKNSHLELIPQLIDFNVLIDSACQDYQNPQRENIKIIKHIDTAIPFYNNLLRMKIILNNLISNAIKFQNEAEPDPFIQVNIEVTAEKATIIIQDNGVGIPDKFKNDVFKIFFRASNKSTGSGLGLYIVNDCIQKIQGTLELNSHANEITSGTSIKITIPNIQPEY